MTPYEMRRKARADLRNQVGAHACSGDCDPNTFVAADAIVVALGLLTKAVLHLAETVDDTVRT